MSLTTLLLALAPPAIFRPKPEPEKTERERELEGQVKALEDELERAWAGNEQLHLERDSARRRVEELQRMLEGNMGYQVLQGQAAAMSAQQAAAQNAAYNACTCVPARHDMLFRG